MSTLEFCFICDKAIYISAVKYHHENPCYAARQGWDCMEFEDETQFCGCKNA